MYVVYSVFGVGLAIPYATRRRGGYNHREDIAYADHRRFSFYSRDENIFLSNDLFFSISLYLYIILY